MITQKIILTILACLSLKLGALDSKELFNRYPSYEKRRDVALHPDSPGKDSVLVIIYMAARNDLFPFAGRHIRQLQNSGANDQVKIFVHLDIHQPGQSRVTKHFFIEKNKILQVGPDMDLDSGDEASLTYTVKTAYELFPAEDVVLIISNHGTGPIEPDIKRAINPSELFHFNADSGLIELDRSVGFLDYISQGETRFIDPKGICFDDSSGNYLTIEKLTNALRIISEEIIHKKLKILACDACLMAGIDVFTQFQPYAKFFVGSQEVELGTGYKYDLVMEPLLNGSLNCDECLARHFVDSYQKAYGEIIDYYTHAAINLTFIDQLERNIDSVAQCLIKGLDKQKNSSVKEMLRISRHKNNCTRFNEPTYLDLGHLYHNMESNLSHCELATRKETYQFQRRLAALLEEGQEIITETVIANVHGEKHRRASGISIYFPEFFIHKSYYHNSFATKTHWIRFLKHYLAAR